MPEPVSRFHRGSFGGPLSTGFVAFVGVMTGCDSTSVVGDGGASAPASAYRNYGVADLSTGATSALRELTLVFNEANQTGTIG